VGRQQAKYLVFFISAVMHEVIVSCCLGFFFPVLFFMFGGPGVIFTQIRFGMGPYTGSVFWLLMLIGCGLLMVLICREYYARNSPFSATYANDGLFALMVPQSLRFLFNPPMK
jgi:hypothetical protein